MSAFLEGRLVHLHATDARAPLGPDAWLDAGSHAEGTDEILMGVRDPGRPDDDDELGVVGLTAIDWIARTARLCAGGQRLPGDAREEAARLVARYAFDELNLESLEAVPTSKAQEILLTRVGFAWDAAGARWVLRRPTGDAPR